MKRRQFLLMTAGGLAVAGAGAGFWLLRPGRDGPVEVQTHLDALARSMAGVAAVGRAWRQASDGGDAQHQLLQSLGLAAGDVMTHDDFVQRLAMRVENDLDQGRIFKHEGWWLAETEARLAGLHVALLGDQASEAVAPEFDNAPEGQVVELQRFQPRSLRQGEIISRPGLPEGVIWFATAEPPPPRLVVYFSDRRLTVRVTRNGFSIRVPDSLMEHLNANPGEHEIWLYDPVVNRRQRMGTFTVHIGERDDHEFCTVERWGPRETVAGRRFNEQADGSSAIFVGIACFPASTVVVFDGVELPTTLRPDDGVITANFPDPTLYDRPGEYAIELLDRRTGNTQPVGSFVVGD